MVEIAQRVVVEIGYDLSESMECLECERACPHHYDHGEMREWRHLNTMQFEALLRCEMSRCNCPEHGVKTLRVLWPGRVRGSPFCSSVKSAAELIGLNWHQVNQIKRRAVARGLKRREASPIKYLGIDEKSFRKGHDYVGLLTDLERSRVLDVAEGRN